VTRLGVTATVTAEKGGGLIRIVGSQLDAVVEGLAGVDAGMLEDIARAAEQACTISALLRASVPVVAKVREGTVT
jgi:organic hydroperoxide reductase OsmC/OhrA